jgi:hypothetical protein
MLRASLAGAALLVFAGSVAYAQTASPAVVKNYNMQKSDVLASGIIGMPVYSSIVTGSGAPTAPANGASGENAATANGAMAATTNTPSPGNAAPASGTTATNPNGVPARSPGDTDAQKLGTIRNLVLGADGKVVVAIIGVGGFMGLSERNVAVDFTQLHWAVDHSGKLRGTLATTAQALNAAPAFNLPDSGEATTITAPPINRHNTPTTDTGLPSPRTAPPASNAAAANKPAG